MDLKQFTQTQEDLGYNLDAQRINEAWERFKTTNRTLEAAVRVLDVTIRG